MSALTPLCFRTITAYFLSILTFTSCYQPVERQTEETPIIETASDEFDWGHGANAAWINYGRDFSARPTERQGLESNELIDLTLLSDTNPANLTPLFEQLRSSNVSWIRWHIFGDGQYGLVLDDKGDIERIDESVFDNLAYLFNQLPASISIVPVVFDHTICNQSDFCERLNGPDFRTQIIERIYIPLTSRFHHVDRILAWELFSELDRYTAPRSNMLSELSLSRFIEDASLAIHQAANKRVTVGLAFEENISIIQHTSIDVFQFHWYPTFEYDPVPTFNDYSAFDRPVILGEYPAHDPVLVDRIQQNGQRAHLSSTAFWRAVVERDSTDEFAGFPEF